VLHVIYQKKLEIIWSYLLIYLHYIQLFCCWECEEELWQEKMERIRIIFLLQVFKVWKDIFRNPYVWDISNWRWCLVLSTLIGDSQNQSYLYLGTLIPFKLKVRSEFFPFFLTLYSYSFVESVRQNCDKKKWKEFWSHF
jgi:hypothetical protein